MRWLAGILLCLGLLTVADLWTRATMPFGFDRFVPAQVERQRVLVAQLSALRSARDAAVDERDARLALRGRTGQTALVFAPPVPVELIARLQPPILAQLASLPASRAVPVQVLVVRAPMPDDARATLRPRLPLDVLWILPNSAGAPCTALVRVRQDDSTALAMADAQEYLGPCRFYAQFGLPGRVVGRWMTRHGAGLAIARSAPPVAGSFMPGGGRVATASRMQMALPLAGCLRGDDAACLSSLGMMADSLGPASVDRVAEDVTTAPVVATQTTSIYGRRLGLSEAAFLQSLLDDFGFGRFASFWQNSAAVPEAFVAAFGERPESYLRRWLARWYDAAGGGPAATGIAMFGALALAVGAVGVAVRGGRPA